MADNPIELLQRFNHDRSEAAFRDLVRQHSPLVYATALRRLNGDRSAAQDVMQEVFTLLVRKAASLDASQLSAWLYRQTCRRAANHVRAESRRRQRELVSVEAMNHPPAPGEADGELLSRELDSAMLTLPSSDRHALVMRYLEDRDFRSVAGALGLTEVAARKRVSRALEKLAAVLKRRGITTGSALLGSTMSGMGKATVPEAVISQISTSAIQALPAAGWTSLLALLKPFLAGTLAASLVAASVQTLRPPSTATVSSLATTPPTKSRRPDNLGPLPSASSLEDVITEIKRVNSGPGNALTDLRMDALLSRIANDQIPAFIAAANGKLSARERAASYPRLLERWVAADPDVALSFTAEQKIGEQVNPDAGSNLLYNLFSSLVRRDRAVAAAWLVRNWTLDALAEPAFENSMRDSMCFKVVEDCVLRDGKDALLALLRSLPTAADQETALMPLCGELFRYQGIFLNARRERLIECYEALKELPDEELRHSVLPGFWKNVAEQRPKDLEAMQASLDPAERFYLALGKLGTQQIATETIPLATGGFLGKSEPVTNRSTLEAAAMEAGRAAGLPQEEIMNAVAETMAGTLRGKSYLAWLEQHRGEFDIDATLATMVRKQARSNGSIGGERFEVSGILLAAHIRDPELRLRLSRGAYRRILERDRPAALACLARTDLPPEFVAEFKKITGEAP